LPKVVSAKEFEAGMKGNGMPSAAAAAAAKPHAAAAANEQDVQGELRKRLASVSARAAILEEEATMSRTEAIKRVDAEKSERLEAEKLRIAEEEANVLKEKNAWKKETDAIRRELRDVKADQRLIADGVDDKIDEKLGDWDGNPHKNIKGEWLVELPPPVTKEIVDYNKSVEGDEEYWLQNLSASRGDVSDMYGDKSRHASAIEFFE